MPFLHQRHHTENPDRLKSSLPGSQQLGTSACHGWMVQEWPLNVEYLDRVDETCTSDIFSLEGVAILKNMYELRVGTLLPAAVAFSALIHVRRMLDSQKPSSSCLGKSL